MLNQLDHRQIAEEMDIFFFNEQIGAGLPVWLPNGVAIRDALENFIRDLERRGGYQRVVSPHIAKEDLYRKSGHLQHFKEDMFPPMQWPEDNQLYYLKPMNCPHHHKVFSSSPRSFRQLPLRIAEYGQVYRYEPSGSIRGLSRVRGLCQNDAHIYVDPSQSLAEIIKVLELHELCYKSLGLNNNHYRLSKRDAKRPEDFQGDPSLWDHAEEILRKALEQLGLLYFEAEGEAAFYGPKIDVQMMMGGQEESIASVQLDFLSAKRFDLSYVASSGENQEPWIIHRAPLGSHERFIAMLLEFYQGQLPGWLAPVQVYLLPVSENEIAFAKSLAEKLLLAGVRVKLEESAGSLSKRILFAHRERPFCKIILGKKEIAMGKVKLQLREKEIEMDISELEAELKKLLMPPTV